MTAEAPSRSRGATVLTLESAIALFSEGLPEDGSTRDRAATTALRQATGRDDIAIERRESGRPRLNAPYPELGVSLAGCGGILLIGFSPTDRVGVDLEPEDSVPITDVGRLSADHYALAEARAVQSSGPTSRARDLFLRLWVAKEAALKLTGRGVFDGLHQPDFSTHLAKLLRDDAILDVAPSSVLPRFRVAVRRVIHDRSADEPSRPRLIHYCALAVCAA